MALPTPDKIPLLISKLIKFYLWFNAEYGGCLNWIPPGKLHRSSHWMSSPPQFSLTLRCSTIFLSFSHSSSVPPSKAASSKQFPHSQPSHCCLPCLAKQKPQMSQRCLWKAGQCLEKPAPGSCQLPRPRPGKSCLWEAQEGAQKVPK